MGHTKAPLGSICFLRALMLRIMLFLNLEHQIGSQEIRDINYYCLYYSSKA